MAKIFKNKICFFYQKKYFKQGFMVIEVLITASIITVSILAFMMVAQKSLNVSYRAFHINQAVFLLEEGAEAVRVLRDNSWSNISSLTAGVDYYPTFSGGTWILSSTPNSIGIFTRTVNLASVNRDNTTKDISAVGTDDPGTKLVTVKVSWLEGGVVTEKNLQFYLANIFP